MIRLIPGRRFEGVRGLVLLLLLVSLMVGYVLHQSWKNKVNSHYSEHHATLDTAYRGSIQMYRLAMEAYYHNVLNVPQVSEILEEAVNTQGGQRDLARAKLYRMLNTSFQMMKTAQLQQLHFHLPDGTSFLRFHQPEKFGDNLFESRPGVRICNTEQRIVQGFEGGSTRPSFRYIFPLFANGKHVGSVEVGITVKYILEALKNLDSKREYTYVLNTVSASKTLFPDQKWLYSPSAIHPQFLIEDVNAILPDSPALLSREAKSLNLLLSKEQKVQQAMTAGQPLTVSEKFLGDFYTVALLPMKDVSGQLAGYIITYMKDPVIGRLFEEYLLVMLCAFGAVCLIFLLALRLRARTALLSQERHNLTAMNDALAEGVYVMDIRGVIKRVNPSACQILGYTQSEIEGQNAHDLFHRNDDGSLTCREECNFYKMVRDGKSFNGEETFLTKSGKLILAEVACRPIIRNGKATGSVTAFHDITDRKKIENELRRSEEVNRKLALAVEQSPTSVMITDPSGVFEYVNSRFLDITGYEKEELIGKNFKIIKSNLEQEHRYRHLWESVSAGNEWQGMLQTRRKSGEMFWSAISISPLRNSAGLITHLVAMLEDITEKMQIEAELRDMLVFQQTLMESLPVGLVIIDQESRVIEQVNPFAAQLFGAEASKIIGNRCHSFLCPANEDSCPIIDLGKIVDNADRIMICADGSHAPVLKTVKAITIMGKAKLLECFVDIRERKKVEHALQESIRRAELLAREAEAANRAKSDFLANMSHEIRTPMNAVLGMTHLALCTELTNQQREYMEKVDRSARALLGVLNDILDLSKVEAGKLELEHTGFNLHEVLDNLTTIISARIHDKNIELVVGADHNVPERLIGDPLRLGQILINLSGNAAKFTREGEICIRVHLENKVDDTAVMLRFEITDSGVGMEPSQLEHLFAPFMQADVSTARKFGGTGLGLSISRQLVLLMGGDISVKSVPGVGSTFSFTAVFQLDESEQTQILPEELQGTRIMVIDDTDSVRSTMAEYFRMLNLNFWVTAASGTEGIRMMRDAVRKAPVDLLFIDWKMPEMDGFQTFRAIMEDADIAVKPKVILMSAFGFSEIQQQAEQAGFAGFLSKPISFHQLLSVIHGTLDGFAAPRVSQSSSYVEANSFRFAGGKVLLVEDNEFNRQVASGILENAGLEVVTANDGEDALRLVQTDDFDVVLMDIQMPKMNGFEATRHIRQLPGGDSIPIVSMTAYATMEERDRIRESGMDDYIGKPIDLKVLFSVLGRWLKPLAAAKKEDGNERRDTSVDSGQAASKQLVTSVLDMTRFLEMLVPVLHSCKPKQCSQAVESMSALHWPAEYTEDITKIANMVDGYEFILAQHVAEALLERIRNREEKN